MKTKSISPNLYFYLGLFAFAFGITALSVPNFTMKIMVMIIGGIITAGGLGMFIFQLKKRSENTFLFASQLFFSLLNIAFGIVLLSIPNKFVEILIIILGVLLCFGGILNLFVSLVIKPTSNFGKMFIGIALAMLIAGVVFIINPFGTGKAITLFFGLILTIYGLNNLMMSFWIRAEKIKANNDKKQTIEIEANVIEEDGN